MADPRDFLLNTDYEMDKIILVKTGSIVGTTDIPHNLSFAPLPFGVWSTDPNFTTVNTIGVSDIPPTVPGQIQRLGLDCVSHENTISLIPSGQGKDSTTIYYRLYGFEPPNNSADVPSTSDLAKSFVLNTDYNYRKIMAIGTFTQSYQEYAHNLGYLPQVMAWGDYRGWNPSFGIEPIMYSSYFTDSKIVITNNKIKVGKLMNGEKVYWRIYYDEA